LCECFCNTIQAPMNVLSLRDNTSTYNVKMASAAETITKAEVRRMYEVKYLDASKAFGKDIAESIFPDLMTSANTEKEPAPTVVPAP
jgi:hypothetical protein